MSNNYGFNQLFGWQPSGDTPSPYFDPRIGATSGVSDLMARTPMLPGAAQATMDASAIGGAGATGAWGGAGALAGQGAAGAASGASGVGAGMLEGAGATAASAAPNLGYMAAMGGIRGVAAKAALPYLAGQLASGFVGNMNIGGENSGTDRFLTQGLKGAGIGGSVGALIGGIPTLGIGAPLGGAIGAGVGFIGGGLAGVLWGDDQTTAQKLGSTLDKQQSQLMGLLNNAQGVTPESAQQLMSLYNTQAQIAVANNDSKGLKALVPQMQQAILQQQTSDLASQKQLSAQMAMQGMVGQMMKPYLDQSADKTASSAALINNEADQASKNGNTSLAGILHAQAAALEANHQQMATSIMGAGSVNPYGAHIASQTPNAAPIQVTARSPSAATQVNNLNSLLSGKTSVTAAPR